MPVSGLAFELLAVSERCALLVALERLLSMGLEETFSVLVACNVKTSALHDPRRSPPLCCCRCYHGYLTTLMGRIAAVFPRLVAPCRNALLEPHGRV